MKKQFLFSLIVILPLIYSCNNKANDTNNISIAVSDMSKDSLISLKNGFINKYPNINIKIKEFKDASSINYLLNHNKLDCDLVAFEEFNDSIIFSSKLALLNRYEGINELSNDMLTHIKDTNGNIYSIPSVGKLYCNILNLDLFKEYDIPLYNTIDELKNIPNIEGKEIFTSTFTNSMLDCLMQLSIPTFLSSVEGIKFLNDYYDGIVSIKDTKYEEIYIDIFTNLYSLYQKNFFAPTLNKGDTHLFYEGNAFINSIVYNENATKIFGEKNVNFSYMAYPFVGYTSFDKWVAAKPQFYLSVVSSSLKEKSDSIFDLLNYFLSADGQQCLITLENNELLTNCYSYLKDFQFQLYSPYSSLKPYIDSGKVYIVDTIRSVYFKIFDPIIKYLSDDIDMENLIIEVDKIFKDLKLNTNKLYYFEELSKFSGKNKTERKSTLNYFSSLLCNYLNVDFAILLDSLLINYIYDGILYASELKNVIDENLFLTNIEVKGKDLLSFLNKFKDEFSSLNINIKNETIDNKKIDKEKIYNILVPSSLVSEFDDVLSLKGEDKAIDLFKNIFDNFFIKNNAKMVE